MARQGCDRIYLASQSPRRQELLRSWGVAFDLLLADENEDAEALEVARPNESPRVYVRRVTQLKLEAAMRRRLSRGLVEAPVLCADTTVALGRDILGKPQSKRHASEMLARLSGCSHDVYTAVALAWGHESEVLVSHSKVTFAPLSARQINAYVATGEPMGKAGAYGIQGLASLWISQIKGSYSGIMGLPAYETALLLDRAGCRMALRGK